MSARPTLIALMVSALVTLGVTGALWSSPESAAAKPLDTDGDGCLDAQEFGPSVVLGGQRDPQNFWDFMDVPTGQPPARDQRITVGDIGAVVARFGSAPEMPLTKEDALTEAMWSPPPAAPAYHPAYDRGGSTSGGKPWDLLPPDGSISIVDVGAAVSQFGHSCA